MENYVLGMFPFATIPGHQRLSRSGSVPVGQEHSGSAHCVYRLLQVLKIKTYC